MFTGSELLFAKRMHISSEDNVNCTQVFQSSQKQNRSSRQGLQLRGNFFSWFFLSLKQFFCLLQLEQ